MARAAARRTCRPVVGVTFGPPKQALPMYRPNHLPIDYAFVQLRLEDRMHPIIGRSQLSPNVTRLVIEAPRIAQIRQAGPVRHRPRR